MSGRRGRGGHGGGGHGSSERWLITYADLITLLLVFFVVLYALSQVDKAKYEKLKQSLSSSMSVVDMKGTNGSRPSVTDGNLGVLTGGTAVIMPEQLELESMEKDVQEMAKAEELSDMVETKLDKEGMVISISSAGFFQSGESLLTPEAIPMLDKIAQMLARHPQRVRIEGHTDNIPIATARFASNWELSAMRATTIVRFLIERHRLDPRRLTAAGYGEYYPKVANDTEAHRAANRRVEIVILRDQPAPAGGR